MTSGPSSLRLSKAHLLEKKSTAKMPVSSPLKCFRPTFDNEEGEVEKLKEVIVSL